LSKTNFKLPFTTWVLPINKHQASNLTISLSLLSCTTTSSSRLLPTYALTLRMTIVLTYFHSQHQAIHIQAHIQCFTSSEQLAKFHIIQPLLGYTTFMTIVFNNSELHSFDVLSHTCIQHNFTTVINSKSQHIFTRHQPSLISSLNK
jgi:hypothetical protein